MSLKVLDAGLLTTVQDHGRTGFRAFGMPSAGAMDRYALSMANVLAGNAPTAAALEMTVRGGRYQFTAPAYAAIAGAEMNATLDGHALANWSSFYAPSGSELALDFAATGVRAYVAVFGGIDVPLVMGSRATYLRAAVGGFAGRALQAGDELAIGVTAAPPQTPVQLSAELTPQYPAEITLRVLLGPQQDYFTSEGVLTFLQGSYAVSHRNDRMGYRLEGPVITHRGAADIVSDALLPGAVQVPGSGESMVMTADCQTTGGYAKIATVIGSDLWRLAQCRAADRVRFSVCSGDEAVAALQFERECYDHAAQQLRAARGR